jgi:FkbM family methyltransferase
MDLRALLRRAPGGEWAYRRLWRRRHPCLPPAGSDDSRELYDLQTAAVLSHVLGRASVCVDGGAHEGSILQHMLRFAPDGRHHAVEPLPHLAGRLRAEFPGVTVHQCALAERDGQAAFTFVKNDPGYSGLRRRDYDRPDPLTRQLAVRTRRLDDLLPPDCPVAVIKLDLEGGEYHALLGARATVRRCRPVVVFEFGLGGGRLLRRDAGADVGPAGGRAGAGADDAGAVAARRRAAAADRVRRGVPARPRVLLPGRPRGVAGPLLPCELPSRLLLSPAGATEPGEEMKSAQGRGPGRLAAVDALRGLGALGVVCFHLRHPVPEPGSLNGWLFLPATVGMFGLALLLVISGFCIHLTTAKALARGEGARCNWVEFWARRFRRLYPPYLAALLFTFLLALAFSPNRDFFFAAYRGGASPARDLFSHLTLVHNLFERYALGLGNSPLWTLGMEEQLYALYAVLLLLRARLSAAGTFAVAAAVTLLWFAASVLVGALGRPWVCWYLWPFAYWLVWALGALAAEAHTGAITLPRWCRSGPVAAALLALAVLLLPVGAHLPTVGGALLGWARPVGAWLGPLHMLATYAGALGGFVLLNRWLSAAPGGAVRGRAAAALAWVGAISCSLYLTHMPLLHLAEAGFGALGVGVNILSTLARYALCVPLCLAVGWGFFVLVERRFLNRPRAEAA